MPSSVSRNGDCLHVWLTGRAHLMRLFQKTLFRQTDPVTGDAVRFLYTLLSSTDERWSYTCVPGIWKLSIRCFTPLCESGKAKQCVIAEHGNKLNLVSLA